MIDRKQFTQAQLDRKVLFWQRQRLFLDLFNKPSLRDYTRDIFGIKENLEIIKVTPNSVHFLLEKGKDVTILSRHWGDDTIYKELMPTISKLDIALQNPDYANNIIQNKDEAFLHFADEKIRNDIYPQIYLTTDTFGASGGQGQILISGVWATIHAASTGDSFSTSDANRSRCAARQLTGGGDTDIFVPWFPYDTSSIPDAASITSSNLKPTPNADSIVEFGANSVVIVQSFQASNTALATTDFGSRGDAVTNPTLGSSTFLVSGFANDTQKTMALNATGLTWISTTGYSKFVIREYTHDCLNVTPIATVSSMQALNFYPTANGTAGNRPVLDVTYTVNSNHFLSMLGVGS